MDLPKRKLIRLRDYDYSKNGAYFITICTRNHVCLLGNVTVGDGVLDVPIVHLSDYGNIVKNQIEEMNAIYTHLEIIKYVIMPNHIHLMMMINASNEVVAIPDGTSRTPSPTNAIIPQFVSTLKRYTNKQIKQSIWQRSYYDHIIRNEKQYETVWQYIHTNPQRWRDDCYHVE